MKPQNENAKMSENMGELTPGELEGASAGVSAGDLVNPQTTARAEVAGAVGGLQYLAATNTQPSQARSRG